MQRFEIAESDAERERHRMIMGLRFYCLKYNMPKFVERSFDDDDDDDDEDTDEDDDVDVASSSSDAYAAGTDMHALEHDAIDHEFNDAAYYDGWAD